MTLDRSLKSTWYALACGSRSAQMAYSLPLMNCTRSPLWQSAEAQVNVPLTAKAVGGPSGAGVGRAAGRGWAASWLATA
jgi:hypothetical protein